MRRALVVRMMGGIDGVVEVCFLHGGKAPADGGTVAAFHEIFTSRKADGADGMHGFRNNFIGSGHGFPVLHLGRQHAFLESPGEEEEKWQGDEEEQEKSPAQEEYGDEDGNNFQCVGGHADDAGVEEVFYGVHVIDKEGSHGASFVGGVVGCGKAGEFIRHHGADMVGHFLAEYGDIGFLRRIGEARQGGEAEVQKTQEEQSPCGGAAGGEAVDGLLENQGRQDAQYQGHQDDCQEAGREPGAHGSGGQDDAFQCVTGWFHDDSFEK